MQNGSSRGPREDTLPNAVIQEEDARWTPLHEATAIGDEKRVQTLLAANADRTAKESKHGNTPLHEAAWRGFSRCVKVLCAPPNPKKEQKDKKLKDVLQETRGALHSALLGIRNDGGFSALHLAAQNGHNQSCREILLAGGDPDIQNNYGDTALHTACRYGHAGATRILLSATCDSNKANLNGDSPLHIACAMGRRKLTRILLEAGSNMTVRNSQEETPRDIAIRKNYIEILNILDNPKKSRREKDKSNGSGGGRNSGNRKSHHKGDRVDGVANPVSWSPYGCHYFPDPSSFPSPKLDTLPKEPLQKGEQYFLDLAGNICKGPVGVGNTCYCGPFFRHIEDKINQNRKSLRKYVFKATERLDSKVQALAIRTDDQIEQLTRSMIADRIRCESRRLHLEHWLKRGEPYRLTTAGHQSRLRKKQQPLSRCKSLELLDDDSMHGSKVQNSKSFDDLEEAVVTVHREAENSDDDCLSVASLGRTDRDEKRWDRLETDYFNVSERLEELLAKTNEILEMEKEASKRRKEELQAFTEPTFKRRERRSQNVISMGKDVIEQLHQVTLEDKKDEDINQITVLPLEEDTLPSHGQEASGGTSALTNDYVTYLSRMQSGRTSPHSSHRPLQEKYQSFSQIHSNEHMLQDVISAIRKDHQMVKDLIESETHNEMENTHEDKLSYKDEQTLLNVNGFFQNTCFDDSIDDSPSNTLKAENKVTMTSVKNISELCEKPFEIPTYAELNKVKPRVEATATPSKDWRRKAIKNSNKDLEDLSERVNGTIKKVEIKNSEIKTLKKPPGGILKRSKVQELVARLQGKLSSSITVKSTEHDDSSESSEDEHNEHNEVQQLENNQMHMGAYTSYRQPQMNSPNNSNVVPANNMVQTSSSTSLYSTPIPNNSYPYRLIPKDAYFHELPNKGRAAPQPYSYSNQSDPQMQKQQHHLPNNYYQHHQQHHQNLQNQQQQQQQQMWGRIPSERRLPVSMQQQHPSVTGMINPSYASPYNNMPPLMVHTPPQPLRTPVAERLLTNRKFMPPNSSSPDYELAATPVGLKNCNQMQNANLLLQQSSTAGLIATMDHQQHMVERDVSNDSGFSTRIYGGGSESHRPSPSLSGHTDYGGMQSPSHGLMYTSGHVPTEVGDVTYYMGNVSSLV